ncbi:MAG: SIR2 family NAD-dependent protein deacylase [Exilispira sp.]
MDKIFYENCEKALDLLLKSKYPVAFTGAGISVESGIAPFRGKTGLYEKVSSRIFDLDYFYSSTKNCWYLLLKFIIIPLLKASPNDAHLSLAKMQKKGFIKSIITQNIDNLHEKAESFNIIKFHGSADRFSCIRCHKNYKLQQIFKEEILNLIEKDNIEEKIKKDKNYFYDTINLSNIDFNVPKCISCGSIIKPDIVFFKEPIAEKVLNDSFIEAQNSDLLLIIGTSGVVYPAAMIPQIVKRNNGKIIEINPETSEYTTNITDIFIQSNASKALLQIVKLLDINI